MRSETVRTYIHYIHLYSRFAALNGVSFGQGELFVYELSEDGSFGGMRDRHTDLPSGIRDVNAEGMASFSQFFQKEALERATAFSHVVS